MKKKFEYPILTPEQQYDNLLSKGLIMDQNKDQIIFFLTHHSYFKMMLYFRPYWIVDGGFGHRKFNKGITRTRILQDFNFDHDMRILFFSYIIYIENSFKNTLCQLTCQKLGNIRRTEKNNFDDPQSTYEGNPPQVFIESIHPILSEIILGKSKHEHIQKYIDKHDNPIYPPFRNMIEVFTFGQVVKIYKYLKDLGIKKDIAKQYNMDDQKLSSWMKTIVDARNICCHHNKLFDKTNWKIAKVRAIEPILNQKYDTLYHVYCLMKYLLQQIRQDDQFTKDIRRILDKYPNVNTSFPSNWENL